MKRLERGLGCAAVIVAGVTALLLLMLLFSDLGPGETQASRDHLTLVVLLAGGLPVVLLTALAWVARRRR